jgi:hypothetical protein
MRCFARAPRPASGEKAGSLRISYPAIGFEQEIRFVSRPCRFGGRRFFFECPATGRRCSVLWRPPGAKRFACRQAWIFCLSTLRRSRITPATSVKCSAATIAANNAPVMTALNQCKWPAKAASRGAKGKVSSTTWRLAETAELRAAANSIIEGLNLTRDNHVRLKPPAHAHLWTGL